MDANAGGPYNIRHSSNSSSSAVDLTGTGLGTVVPPSPTLRPSDTDGRAYTRRRLSWSNIAERGRPDPPRLNLPAAQEPGPFTLAVPEEDPFFSSADRPLVRKDSSLFSTSHPDASSTSLLSALGSGAEPVPDDDEMRLTGEAQPKARSHWSRHLSVDSERSAGVTSRPRRYTTTTSPLQRTGTALKNALRHASTRVANVRGHRPSIQLREGSEDSDSDSTLDGIEEMTQRDVGERVAHPARPSIPLRGRALGFLGPTNPLRLRLYKLLIHPYACFRLSFHSLRL